MEQRENMETRINTAIEARPDRETCAADPAPANPDIENQIAILNETINRLEREARTLKYHNRHKSRIISGLNATINTLHRAITAQAVTLAELQERNAALNQIHCDGSDED